MVMPWCSASRASTRQASMPVQVLILGLKLLLLSDLIAPGESFVLQSSPCPLWRARTPFCPVQQGAGSEPPLSEVHDKPSCRRVAIVAKAGSDTVNGGDEYYSVEDIQGKQVVQNAQTGMVCALAFLHPASCLRDMHASISRLITSDRAPQFGRWRYIIM